MCVYVSTMSFQLTRLIICRQSACRRSRTIDPPFPPPPSPFLFASRSLLQIGEKHRNNRVQPASATRYGYARGCPYSSLPALDVIRTMTRPDSGIAGKAIPARDIRSRGSHTRARHDTNSIASHDGENGIRQPPPPLPDLSVTLTLWRWSLTHTPLALLIPNKYTHIYLVYPTTPCNSIFRSSLSLFPLFINPTLPLINKVYPNDYLNCNPFKSDTIGFCIKRINSCKEGI